MARKEISYLIDVIDAIRETITPSGDSVHKIQRSARKVEKAVDKGTRRAAKKMEHARESIEDMVPKKKARFPWFFVSFALAAGTIAWLVRRNQEKIGDLGESITRSVRQAIPVTSRVGTAERSAPQRTASTTGRVQVYYTPEGSELYRQASQRTGTAGPTGQTYTQPSSSFPTSTANMETTQPSTSRKTSAQKSGQQDDLEVVEGIGPKISKLLHQHDIHTYQQLADADPAQLDRILKDAGMTLANPSTWPAQARMAQNGEWDSLRSLQDQIKNGVKRG